MNDVYAMQKRLRLYAKELLERAALVADQVEATAKLGDGKDTAAEIGRRIRALMEEGRDE